MHTSVRHHRSFSFQLIRTEKLGQIFHCENFPRSAQGNVLFSFTQNLFLKYLDTILECFNGNIKFQHVVLT